MKKSRVSVTRQRFFTASNCGLLLLLLGFSAVSGYASPTQIKSGNSGLSSGGPPPPKTPPKAPPKRDPPPPTPRVTKTPPPANANAGKPIKTAPKPPPNKPNPPVVVAPRKPAGPRTVGSTTETSEIVQTTPEALRLAEEGNHFFELHTREGYLQAADKFTKAYEVYYSITNRRSQGFMAFNAGTSYLNADENTLAVEWFDKSIEAYQHQNDKGNEADGRKGQAQAYCRLSEKEKCALGYQNAAVLYLNANRTKDALENFRTAGKVFFELRRLAEARALFVQTVEIAKGAGDTKGEIDSLSWVARSYEKETNYASALESYQAALAVARTAHPTMLTELLNNLGVNYLRLGDYDKATTAHQEALDIAQSRNDATGITVSQSYLDQVRRAKEKAAVVTP